MIAAILCRLTTNSKDWEYGLTLPGQYTKLVRLGHYIRVKVLRIKK